MLQFIIHIAMSLWLGCLALVEIFLLIHILFGASFLALSTVWCVGLWLYILGKKGVPFP